MTHSSKEKVCSNGKYDKRENYDYSMWQQQHSSKNIKTTRDGFLFNANDTEYQTKAETVEFSQNSSGSSIENDKFYYKISIFP